MTTAIIGIGTIGRTIAAQLDRAGEPLVLVGRDRADVESFAADLAGDARVVDLDEAVAAADTLVFATWFRQTEELLAGRAGALSGKVVVDVSNPLEADGAGGLVKALPADQTSGELLAGSLPDDVSFVKAFGTLGAESLAAQVGAEPRKVLFFASRDPRGTAEAERLIDAAGWDAVRVGGIERSLDIEVGGRLHEFGGLGRTVTRDEALAALAD